MKQIISETQFLTKFSRITKRPFILNVTLKIQPAFVPFSSHALFFKSRSAMHFITMAFYNEWPEKMRERGRKDKKRKGKEREGETKRIGRNIKRVRERERKRERKT